MTNICNVSFSTGVFPSGINIAKVFFCFLLVFTPCKAEQPLRGMELQEKEAQKG